MRPNKCMRFSIKINIRESDKIYLAFHFGPVSRRERLINPDIAMTLAEEGDKVVAKDQEDVRIKAKRVGLILYIEA